MTKLIWKLSSFFTGVVGTTLVVLSASQLCLGASQLPQQDVPVVVSAAVPFYPPDAQMAHIEGVVQLSVCIDGEAVTGVERLDGQIMLARAAMANVKTWRLQWHGRTTFEATFRYKLLPEFVCGFENPTILLRLPLDVEVTANGLKTCDPSTEIKPKEHNPRP